MNMVELFVTVCTVCMSPSLDFCPLILSGKEKFKSKAKPTPLEATDHRHRRTEQVNIPCLSVSVRAPCRYMHRVGMRLWLWWCRRRMRSCWTQRRRACRWSRRGLRRRRRMSRVVLWETIRSEGWTGSSACLSMASMAYSPTKWFVCPPLSNIL